MEMEEHKKEWIKLNGAWCQIDEECVDWVLLFNKVGLTTKFCCHGEDTADNNYMIMFHEDVMDEQINEFLLKYPKMWGFFKWTRSGGPSCEVLYHNWMFRPFTKKYAKDIFENLYDNYEDTKAIIDTLRDGYELINMSEADKLWK